MCESRESRHGQRHYLSNQHLNHIYIRVFVFFISPANKYVINMICDRVRLRLIFSVIPCLLKTNKRNILFLLYLLYRTPTKPWLIHTEQWLLCSFKLFDNICTNDSKSKDFFFIKHIISSTLISHSLCFCDNLWVVAHIYTSQVKWPWARL